jgi:hypothetical protein
MHRRGLWLAAVSFLAVAVASGADATPTKRPRVTIIGDSVSASLLYVTAAQHLLRRRYDLKLDLEVCRRLVVASCVYQGTQPTTALEAVKRRRGTLGRTVIIDVGYSDTGSTYPAGLDRVMRALRAAGARRVIWTTLRENGSANYHVINTAIRHARRRWPQLRVADWNSWSRGRPWFADDGLHLNGDGAIGLARLFRKTAGDGRP